MGIGSFITALSPGPLLSQKSICRQAETHNIWPLTLANIPNENLK